MHPLQSRRLTRSFVQHIHASPEEVFPLLCPEREKEWLPGWDARMICSASGIAERGAVFESPNDKGPILWLVTEYDSPQRIAFARWQPDGLVVHLEIALGRHHDASTAVCITYDYTAANDAGLEALKNLTPEAWLKTMGFWQESMNQWLADPAHRRPSAP
jgi:hypothetical protein